MVFADNLRALAATVQHIVGPVATALVMMSLVTGSSLLEERAIVGSQMLYGLFIFALILPARHNRLYLDRWLSHSEPV